MELKFNESEQAILNEISNSLHVRGWTAHVTVARLLQNWQELSLSVDRYTMTVDDYTNDLTSRDALEIVLAECPEPLRSKLRLYVEESDQEFITRTQDDFGNTLGRYFKIRESSGWWWKRRPKKGPLAEFLTARA